MEKFVANFAMLLLCVISTLLILVVLLQRGRGGGLAGAFGGLGGQSAFGTKAGDVFTKITIGLVTAWVLLAGVSGVLARKASSPGKGLQTEAEKEAELKSEDSVSPIISTDGDATKASGDAASDVEDSSTSSLKGDDGETAGTITPDASGEKTDAASSDSEDKAKPASSEPESSDAKTEDSTPSAKPTAGSDEPGSKEE
jgi:preprotein translocase subunit SecG